MHTAWISTESPEFPVSTESLVAPESPVAIESLVDPGSPVAIESLVDPESPVGTESLVDPESPVSTESLVDPKSPVGPPFSGDLQSTAGPQPLVGPQSLLDLHPLVGLQCPAPRVVIPTIRDGRYFFSNEVISTNPALQTDVRDSAGFLKDAMLQINERVQSDSFRATTIQFMCEHVDEYIVFEDWPLHADMPQMPTFQFSSLTQRIDLMSNPTVLAGEVEITYQAKSSKDQSMFQTPSTIPSSCNGTTFSQMRPLLFPNTHR